MKRGKIKIKLGERERLVKFTLSTMNRYDQDHGNGASLRDFARNPMTALLKLTHYGLTFFGNENGLPADFDENGLEIVSDWIDDLNQKELEKLMGALMESVKKYPNALKDDSQEAATPEQTAEMMKAMGFTD